MSRPFASTDGMAFRVGVISYLVVEIATPAAVAKVFPNLLCNQFKGLDLDSSPTHSRTKRVAVLRGGDVVSW